MAEYLSDLNLWIFQHQLVVVSVGVPVLTGLVTWFVPFLTNRATLKAQKKQRVLQVQIQLAEFRQKWIDQLREEIANFCSHLNSDWDENDADTRLAKIAIKIQLLMNPDDKNYEEFVSIQKKLVSDKSDGKDVVVAEIVGIGQKILKREWDRLQRELKEIDLQVKS